MPLVAKLDELGRPAWIALMILGFVFWWPLGLVILAFLLGSRRMGCWNHQSMSRWQDQGMSHWQNKMDRMWRGSGWGGGAPSSGNRAFDDYRAETLRRLEEEQQEFRDFLDRLRAAKDKSEFDQFMAERRNRGPGAPQSQPQT
jgi:hypothetical protein